MSRTVGIDLAAQAKNTAVAVIAWGRDRASIESLVLGVEDAEIIPLFQGADKVGIDCALGWPVEFVEFVANYAQSTPNFLEINGNLESRRRLAYRETDRFVRETTGRWPLSVATDRLGLTAMRAAGLLAASAQAGLSIDRTGQELFAEVYPGAALRTWELRRDGYRESIEIRTAMVEQLEAVAPWFELGDFRNLMINSCDAFDSVIAALIARAVARGKYFKPEVSKLDLVRREGWIALPSSGLAELL